MFLDFPLSFSLGLSSSFYNVHEKVLELNTHIT